MSKTWGFRILRAAFVAILAWVLYQFLDRHDHEWVFIPIAGLALLAWAAEQARRSWVGRKNEADWDRWERAIGDAEARAVAITEVRTALGKATRLGPRLRQQQAHLSVVLAELLDAHGRSEEGARVLAKVDIDALTPSQAVVVRHARVVAYLSAGMIDDAEVALKVRTKDSGEPDMDARLDLLEAMVAIERGDHARARTIADAVEKRLPDDESLRAESRVVRAAAHDAEGDHAAAVALMRGLDASTLESLEQLGPLRVRPLAAEARRAEPSE